MAEDETVPTEPTEGTDATEASAAHDPVDALLDLCVYAPLGFVTDARRVVPELAQKGRAQAAMARMIGEFAVSWGNTKLQSAMNDAQDTAVDVLRRLGVASPEPEQAPGAPVADAHEHEAVPAPGGGGADTPAWLEGRTEADEAEARALAIPDYDNLSASQVVPRLDGLTADELEAVRRYERKHRHRKTILNRVAQLQADTA
jgi:hypothetical protein